MISSTTLPFLNERTKLNNSGQLALELISNIYSKMQEPRKNKAHNLRKNKIPSTSGSDLEHSETTEDSSSYSTAEEEEDDEDFQSLESLASRRNLDSFSMGSAQNFDNRENRALDPQDSEGNNEERNVVSITPTNFSESASLFTNNTNGGVESRDVSEILSEFKLVKNLTFTELQEVFNCFKRDPYLSPSEIESLISLLSDFQHRGDFQWALHQLGGFNSILFLYARVVEICPEDSVQAKALSLTLTQLKNLKKLSEEPLSSQKHLIRFLLNTPNSKFGFKTFITLVNNTLNSKGTRLEDYELFSIALFSSWRKLLKCQVLESEAPTGHRTLFECLLYIITDLLNERNPHRDLNVDIFKINKFPELLLSVSATISSDIFRKNERIFSKDELIKLANSVKIILNELMAPPDPNVAVSFIKFGLFPLLPKELPPLPRRSDAFFIFHGNKKEGTKLAHVIEAEEILDESFSCSEIESSCDGQFSEVPEVVGVMTSRKNSINNNGISLGGERNSSVDEKECDGEIFEEAILEGLMTTLLNSLSILPDESFRKILEPNLSPDIFISFCSHPNPTLKSLSLQLLSSYLSRVKNPILSEFIKNKGFFLTSIYTQASGELSEIILKICTEFGPVSYALLAGLVHSTHVVNTLIQWIHHSEASVISSLLSMGFLPSVLNFYKNYNCQQLPRPILLLLSVVTNYLVLSPKEEPWKILFCPGIESTSQSNPIICRILQDGTEILRRYSEKELSKNEASNRLLWLLERLSSSRIGHNFDKWLLKIYTANIMEIDDSAETETWKYFIKKHKKRLSYLFGLFLCRIFAPNKGDLDFKQYTVRCLILSCPNLGTWLPKILRVDDQIERSFTAFVRVFLLESETNNCNSCGKNNSNFEPSSRGRSRRPSFSSLISTNTNLGNMLKTATAVGLPEILPNRSVSSAEIHHLSDRALRSRFECLLIESGILSPNNKFISANYSNSQEQFKNFHIFLEATPISGVSHSELRQCLNSVEKMKSGTLGKTSSRRGSGIKMIKLAPNISNIGALQISNSALYFDEIFESVHNLSLVVSEGVTKIRNMQEIELAKRISVRDEDILAKESWWEIRNKLSHPKAPWHFENLYPKFWALDRSEGPSRVRTRLRKEALKINSRFLKPESRENLTGGQPLEFIFQKDCSEYLNYPVLQSEVEFIRFCIRILPGEEYPGEIILSGDSLYFFCEACHLDLDHCNERVLCPNTKIYQILRRRYTLEDRAAEVFIDSHSYLFVFRTIRDREEFITAFSSKINKNAHASKSLLFNSSLSTVMRSWVKGSLSTFDYLMYLNTGAGRTYSDLMQYPVFPFVIAKYDSPTLDLHAPPSYRDLKKPMAIQDPTKEEHFVSTYNYLKKECASTPFHYGSHYSNSGIVLHFLIRLPPYTQHFLKYQDGSFDIPDRSFHSIETTWKLASRESNTDFKEAIPEFYYLPEFLKNLQNFDLGVRQSGQRVDDVNLPPWAKNDARIFTLVNRQALESQQVRKYLSDWIDLIFGYKQTGKPAIDAINVFHPSTYEGFDVDLDGSDELIQKARRTMVSTYGQTPKRLFEFPHPKAEICPVEHCELEAIDTVWGIRWGQFLGSPSSPDLDVVNTREYKEEIELMETSSRVVFWPKKTLILGDSVVGSWDSTGVRIKSTIVYYCIGDEISFVTGTEHTLWVGHQSGKILVLKLDSTQESVKERTELFGHYRPILSIHLNPEFSIALSCSGENYALLWDMNKVSFGNVIEEEVGIDLVYSSKSTGDIVLVNKEKNLISVRTINGFLIGQIEEDEKIESACFTSLDPGRFVNVLAVGCNYGKIKFYSTWDLRLVNQIKVLPIWTLPILNICYSRDGRRLYCLSKTENRYISVALQLSQNNSRKTSS